MWLFLTAKINKQTSWSEQSQPLGVPSPESPATGATRRAAPTSQRSRSYCPAKHHHKDDQTFPFYGAGSRLTSCSPVPTHSPFNTHETPVAFRLFYFNPHLKKLQPTGFQSGERQGVNVTVLTSSFLSHLGPVLTLLPEVTLTKPSVFHIFREPQVLYRAVQTTEHSRTRPPTTAQVTELSKALLYIS